MKYTEVTYPTPHGPEYAFGINDFDSMAIRLSMQLTREQIIEKLNLAQQCLSTYSVETESIAPEQLSYGRVRR